MLRGLDFLASESLPEPQEQAAEKLSQSLSRTTPNTSESNVSSRFRRNHSGSSKPVRCGNPTLGRFDSGAAPSSRFWRVRGDRCRFGLSLGQRRSSAQVRSRPPEGGENYRAAIARVVLKACGTEAADGFHFPAAPAPWFARSFWPSWLSSLLAWVWTSGRLLDVYPDAAAMQPSTLPARSFAKLESNKPGGNPSCLYCS